MAMIRGGVILSFMLVLVPLPAPGLLAAPPWLGGRPDSTQIERLRALGNKPIEIRLLDGTRLQGRATATDSGLVLEDQYWQNASQRMDTTYFFFWSEIGSLRPLKKSSRWPAVLLAAAFAVTFCLIWVPKWTD
ncbi:hypothetical protein LLH00_17665 [bacterium]|nr:hypothetical protein [bacterium]